VAHWDGSSGAKTGAQLRAVAGGAAQQRGRALSAALAE